MFCMKPEYEIRYGYDTAPIRRYGKISKIKIRCGRDTLIKKIIYLNVQYNYKYFFNMQIY